jgi:peptidoglycan hydrolase-like protein with peptidoglycan-binding domain
MNIRATPSRRCIARRVHLATHPLPRKVGASKASPAARMLQGQRPMPVSLDARTADRMHARTASPAVVLALQRALGNRAVRGMLSAGSAVPDAVLQRRIGDGHDLSSPRFAGLPELEACYDDEARLTIGATGSAVASVQQALIDRGYDLGPSGADGRYGQRTWQAVKQFKTDEQLGWEHMGDVGPGTMARLDMLFPAAAPPPPAPPHPTPPVRPPAPPMVVDEDHPAQACPTTDEIVTAVAARPEAAHRLVAQAITPPVVARGTPGGIAAAVTRFKQLVNAKDPATGSDIGENLSNRGQFFWTGQIDEAILGETARLSGGDSDAADFATKAEATRASILRREPDVNGRLAELDGLAAATASPFKAAMQALLRAPQGSGGAIDAALWAAFNLRPDNSLPTALLNRHRSLRTLRAVYAFDSSACGAHAGLVAKRLKSKGGIVPRTGATVALGATLASGGGIRDRRPIGIPASAFGAAATAAVLPRGDFMLGDHIFQVGVKNAVAKMKDALDAGQLVHARVLSGVGYGGNVGPGQPAAKPQALGAPPQEHSLLIIAYDGDSFVFHDPDAGVSHNPEPGFGMLHHDSADARLSTAADPGLLPVDGSSGKHRDGNKRYQIISVAAM